MCASASAFFARGRKLGCLSDLQLGSDWLALVDTAAVQATVVHMDSRDSGTSGIGGSCLKPGGGDLSRAGT